MKARLARRLILGATVALLHGVGTNANAQTGEPILIGVIVAATGPAATVGIPERNATLLAEKAINAKGGINGRPLKLIVKDDTSNPDTALSHANELIFGQKVTAIIGSTTTASTVAVGAVSQKAKILQVAYSGFGPAIERERKCVLHLAASQEVNARAMLEYARGIKAIKVGVLHDAGFGTVVMAELKRLADGYGVTFVAIEKFEPAATDSTTQAAKIKAAQPDAVFVAGVSATPFRDLRRLQMTQPIISHFGGSSYELVSAMGSAADNVIFPEFLIAEDPLPHQAAFVEAYRKEYGTMPKNAEAFSWDGVHALAQALAKAGPGADGDKLCAAIRGPYAGVFGNFDFSADDMNGVRQPSFVYSKLVAGKYTRLPFRAQ